MQDLFAWDFNHNSLLNTDEAKQIIARSGEIDQLIESSAPAWPLSKINKTDLAILRLSVFELIMERDEPYKVVIDEAVELAKEFGSESSSSFVNGVLGKLIEEKIGHETTS